VTLIDFSFRTLKGKRRAKSLSAKTRALVRRATRYLASDAKYGVETKSRVATPESPISPAKNLFLSHRQQLSCAHYNERGDWPRPCTKSARKELKMTTRITRIEGERASEMVLKLEGVVTVADAKLLEEICEDIRRELDHSITIDLSAVNYLGSRSAEVIRRLRTMPGLSIEGAHLFVQQIIESDGNHHE